MRYFEPPVFSVRSPERWNPHLEMARTHLGKRMRRPVTPEFEFYRPDGARRRDRHGFGATGDRPSRACAHPDAPGGESDLVTGRYEGVRT